MKISFDIDGVLADFDRAATDVVREMFLPELPDDYSAQKYSFADVLSRKQWDAAFERMLATPYLWLHIKPFAENVRAVQEYVAAHGDKGIYYITARKDCAGFGGPLEMTQTWLSELMLPWKNVIVVEKTRDKLVHIVDNGIHFSIDDLDRTVELCQGIPNHTAILLDRPYNQQANLPRVFSVAEFLMQVEFAQ